MRFRALASAVAIEGEVRYNGPMTNYTAEQQAAIDAFKAGKSIVLSAFAGTGKTTTLKGMGLAVPERKGLYLAYNKAIQLDAAASFPSNVKCQTAHSVAYGWMMSQPNGKAILDKFKRLGRVPSWTTARVLNIPAQGFNGDEAQMRQNACASAALQTVVRFCNSADTEIQAYHVPREFEGADQENFRVFILPFARKAWADLTSVNGSLKVGRGDDVYLKLWSLACPKLRYSFILFDEAQDANPCIAHVVNNQDAQVIMVGDSNQAIYGWRGAVDAMKNFKADVHLMITQSFRFGPAVAAEANKWLALLEADGQVKGFDKVPSTVAPLTDPQAILCRTNAQAIAEAMEAQAAGRRVALVGGTADIERFVKAAQNLMIGKKTEHEELIAFTTWGEVVQHANEAEGRDLKVMVTLIENYGPEAILDVCNASVDEKTADLIVSTAHKAKGREWDRVRIAPDFRAPEDGEMPRRDEMMLAYVAVTRAKLVLDNSGLSWVNNYAAAVAA